ncbi:Hypothetical_protein [Hexamita inflata]|uniref:Hypothetical_protein n=1 Tax=Hexamita inflata TaxID=28002 RepID=A0AA86PSV3_9EUKA|nr:Hypothetical protein HINF_LOCUS28014 [Hexamita inflata]
MFSNRCVSGICDCDASLNLFASQNKDTCVSQYQQNFVIVLAVCVPVIFVQFMFIIYLLIRKRTKIVTQSTQDVVQKQDLRLSVSHFKKNQTIQKEIRWNTFGSLTLSPLKVSDLLIKLEPIHEIQKSLQSRPTSITQFGMENTPTRRPMSKADTKQLITSRKVNSELKTLHPPKIPKLDPVTKKAKEETIETALSPDNNLNELIEDAEIQNDFQNLVQEIQNEQNNEPSIKDTYGQQGVENKEQFFAQNMDIISQFVSSKLRGNGQNRIAIITQKRKENERNEKRSGARHQKEHRPDDSHGPRRIQVKLYFQVSFILVSILKQFCSLIILIKKLLVLKDLIDSV